MAGNDVLAEVRRHLQAGRLEEAQRLLGGVLEAWPDHPQALHFQGVIAYRCGDPAGAETLLRRAIAACPDLAKAHNNLGNVLAALGRQGEAESAFRRALSLDPDLAEARHNLDLMRGPSEVGDDAAVSAAERQAGAFYRAGKLDEAGASCRRILALRPDHVEALNLAAVIAAERDDTDEALALLEKAINIAPEHAAAHGNMGNVLRRRGQPEAAAAAYRRGLAIEPDRAELHANLGDALQELGRLGEAVAAYGRGLDIDPGLAQAHNNLGTALKDQGKYEEAAASYRRAAAARPDFDDAHYNAARLVHAMGRTDEAVAAYRRVLELDPSNGSARHMVAALGGVTTETAPLAYVRDLFDYYAASFDKHLTEKVGYRIPSLMRRVVDRLLGKAAQGDAAPFARGLDLGCGTGLVGHNFADIVDEFHGVDVAPNMVAEATIRGVYDEVFECELMEFFERFASAPYDLILAADLFIYVGKLEAVFTAVAANMAVGGLFVFSVETMGEGSYALLETGRYAHADAYIGALAGDNGFTMRMQRQVAVRDGTTGPIAGAVFVFVKE